MTTPPSAEVRDQALRDLVLVRLGDLVDRLVDMSAVDRKLMTQLHRVLATQANEEAAAATAEEAAAPAVARALFHVALAHLVEAISDCAPRGDAS